MSDAYSEDFPIDKEFAAPFDVPEFMEFTQKSFLIFEKNPQLKHVKICMHLLHILACDLQNLSCML